MQGKSATGPKQFPIPSVEFASKRQKTLDDYKQGAQLEHNSTLREYYAGQALVGIMGNFTGGGWHNPNEYQLKSIATTAVRLADELIAALAAPLEGGTT